MSIEDILLENKIKNYSSTLIINYNYPTSSTGGSFLITIEILRRRAMCLSSNKDGIPSLNISCVYLYRTSSL